MFLVLAAAAALSSAALAWELNDGTNPLAMPRETACEPATGEDGRVGRLRNPASESAFEIGGVTLAN
jgi:hypothetical protein